jgi:Bacterial membrane protein YfhO
VAEEPPPEQIASVSTRLGSSWPDVLGVLWVLAAACLALVPALLHGPYIGSFDWLTRTGLTAKPGVFLHNASNADLNSEVVPWAQAAWTQVHQGHLPLWIRTEALGMPLAFNFGSAAFSLPALVSYLTPIGAVLWVQILVSFVVGGVGTYFFGRVLGLHPVACAFAGTTWVLSGPFFGYLGLPDTSVMSWAGWEFAAVVLIVRGTHRLWSVALLAVTFALSIYAGNPQIALLIFIPLCIFAAVVLLWRSFVVRGDWPIRRPIVDLVLAVAAGAALSAPLILPGQQLAGGSVRTSSPFSTAYPPSQVLGIVFQKFWGQPLAGSFANAQGFFPESWVYVGAIALALSVVAVAIHWRRKEVAGLAVAALAALATSILPPVEAVLNKLPLVGQTWWNRSLIPLAFCLAMLAGVGLDAVMRGSERRRAARWALGTFGAIAVILGLVWLFGRGNLPAYAEHVRAVSFVWPAVSTAIGLAVFAAMMVVYRRSKEERWSPRTFRLFTFAMAGSLLVCQTVFLIVDDAPIPSSSPAEYKPTPGVTALKQAVGSSLVGVGKLGLGLIPNTNVAFGVHEFAEYDPIAPLTYFTRWYKTNHSTPGVENVYDFIPGINSATVARRYGIAYVLEAHGEPGPSGSVFVTQVGDEDLYRIPGAATATLVPTRPSTSWPTTDAPGKAVPVVWQGPSEVRVHTNATSAQVLRLRIASFPGWRATIDGKPLALTPYLSMMLQAHIPPGKHIIELRYWPKRFSQGLVVAAGAILAFIAVALVSRRRAIMDRIKRPPRD